MALEVRIKSIKQISAIFLRIFLVTFFLSILSFLLMTGCVSTDKDRYELRKEAISLYNDGNYEEAIDLFNKALNSRPGEVSDFQYDILKYRAECELRSGDYEKAKETYQALLSLDEEENQERYNALLDEFEKLDEIEEANSLFNEGDYTAAYDKYKTSASLDGTAAGKIAWFNEAVCAEYLGNYSEAYSLYSEFASEYPDDAEAIKEAEFCRSRIVEDADS